MGNILRFHPLSRRNKEEERTINIKGIDIDYSQFRQEVVKQEIQRELDRKCSGCEKYFNCKQEYDQQQTCWRKAYGHYLQVPKF